MTGIFGWRQMRPYIQFQMYQVETILARAMDVKVDQPIFSSDILRELSTALHTLYEVATGITEMEWIVLDWQEQDEGLEGCNKDLGIKRQ